ncbi:MAG: DUF4397 domain-containing protein, partial [Verrucomicrobiaceae bacterium]|nr:DUF4397 domain-containing protein [Verrucomicrobiaceae bacterium]
MLLSQENKETPEAGFLHIVNLIGLENPTYIELGGFALNGGGAVKPGEGSGVLAIRPGTHPFTLRNAGARPETVTGDFTMEAGKTVAIICYDEGKVYRDGSEEVKLRHTVLAESDTTGPRLSLVSLLRAPSVVVEVSGDSVTLSARRAFQKKVALGDEIHILHQGRTLAEFAIDRPVHHIGFLYQKAGSGGVELSLIEQEKLEYQPPLETEAGEDAE